MSPRTWLLLGALTAASGVLYGTRLDYAPAFLMHDELQFSLQAKAIASTGRDLSGRFLPVFFTEPEFPAGRDPAIIYVTAAALAWLPFSEASVRLPTALLGVLDVTLMFLLARRLFGRDSMAGIAAGFLALTPALFIRSRLVLSPQSSIPIILAWLLSMAAFSDRPSERRLAIGALWLGVGAYTYLAWVVMVPVYLLLTVALGYRWGGRRAAMIAGAAFVAPLIPMAWSYVTHPERYRQVLEAYQLYSAGTTVAPAPGVVSSALQTRLGLFWSFFDPAFLFLSGDSSLINSTRRIGLFPLSFAVFMPLGAYRLVIARSTPGTLVLVGLATAPLAAIVTGALEMNRILFAIPFGVLAACYGADALLKSHSRGWRTIAVLLLAAVPVQFAGFYQDYMGRYRVEAGFWFGGNTREALTAVIDAAGADPQRRVYLSRAIPFAERYWRFYALAGQRPDMIDRAVYYGPDPPAGALPGAALVCPLVAAECGALLHDAGWRHVRSIDDLDGIPSFALLEKRQPLN